MYPRKLLQAVLAVLLCASATSLRAASGSASYIYDDAGRLISVVYEDGTGQVYNYDPAGNRSTSGTLALFSVPTSASVAEGSAITLTVTKLTNPSVAATVNYSVVPGSAVSGTNYTVSPASGTLSFASGQTTQTVSVQTVNDNRFDGPIGFSLVLSSPSVTGAIGQGTEAVTINEASPAPVFSVAAAAATEGSPLSFTVTRTNPTSLAQSVSYATADGAAVAGTDYSAASGTLTFAATDTTKTVQVNSIADSLYEGSRGFTLALSNPTNLAVLSGTQASASGTVNDASSPPSLAINSPAAVTATLPVSFTVSEIFASGTTGTRAATTVNYATANGTAIAGTNYTAASGILTFPAGGNGNQTQTFPVTTLGPSGQTGAVSFTASLSGPNNAAQITTASGTGTINPSGSAPSVPTLSPTSQYTTSGNFSVSWTAANYNPTYYELWNNGSSTTYSGTALSYAGNHPGNGLFTLQVRACNAYGCSAFSNSVRVTVCLNGNC